MLFSVTQTLLRSLVPRFALLVPTSSVWEEMQGAAVQGTRWHCRFVFKSTFPVCFKSVFAKPKLFSECVCVSSTGQNPGSRNTNVPMCKKRKKKIEGFFFPLKCVVWHSNCDKRSVLKCSLPSGLLFHFLPMLGRMLLVHSPPPALGLQHSSGLDSWFPGQLVLIH